jgi:pimeloyl-ACP methyl ester carboxylesterase
VEGGFPHVPGVEHRYVDAGRLRMHVAEAGSGEPLLMLHGWPQHWYLWRDVIPLLAPHARLICPDLRGFGWTAVARGGYDRETMARDVLALMDVLGLERVRLVGHDWGGWIGFLLCLRHPARIERFLACNMLPPWPSRSPRALLDVWRLAYMAALSTPRVGGRLAVRFARLGLESTGALSGDEVDAFVERLGGERARVSELFYRTFLLREVGPVAAGRYLGMELRVPTLVLFGDRDLVQPVRAAREAAARSAAIELQLVPGASHFVVDERPELVAETAIRFFGATSSP